MASKEYKTVTLDPAKFFTETGLTPLEWGSIANNILHQARSNAPKNEFLSRLILFSTTLGYAMGKDYATEFLSHQIKQG